MPLTQGEQTAQTAAPGTEKGLEKEMARIRTCGLSPWNAETKKSWSAILPTVICEKISEDEPCKRTGDGSCAGCAICARLFCSLCLQRGDSIKKNTFTTGSDYFHKKGVQGHRDLVCHQFDFRDVAQPTVVAGFAMQLEDEAVRMKTVMRNAYWLAGENLALWKLPSLCGLSRAQGLPLGKSYTNNHAALDIVHSYAAVLKDDLAAAARASPTLGLMLDESTDVDGKSQLILYLRLRIDGVFVTKFWRIIEVGQSFVVSAPICLV